MRTHIYFHEEYRLFYILIIYLFVKMKRTKDFHNNDVPTKTHKFKLVNETSNPRYYTLQQWQSIFINKNVFFFFH